MAANSVPSPKASGLIADTWTYTNLNTIKLSHKWTINNFSLCKKKPGEFIESSIFSSAETNDALKWHLKLYPSGYTEKDKDYIAIFLHVTCNTSEVTTKFELSIVDAQNKNSNRLEDIKTFLPNCSWGYSKFIEKNKLLVDDVNKLLPDDKLTILCELTVAENIVNISGKSNSIMPFKLPETHLLGGDIGVFLETHQFSDITLIVNRKINIQAHKMILAACSPVFSAMFEHDMEGGQQNQVEINDIDPNVLMEILHFMYTGKTFKLEKMANSILAAADKYALEPLKIMCAKALHTKLTIENAADTLILAHLHNADQLKIQVMDFICLHMKIVTESIGFEAMVNSYPGLAHEIFHALGMRNSYKSILSTDEDKQSSQ